jgi:hypothetical protein
MIQRIQTVYLIIVAGIMLATLFLPLGYIIVGLDVQLFNVFGIHSMAQPRELIIPWTLYYLPVCTVFFAILTLFFYKKRKLQINLCYLTLFSILLFYVFLFMYTYVPGERYALNITFVVGVVLPLVASVFGILAIRGIKKDEKLVRSLDRLR